jgi:serine/threonine protein phosphatase PrpC
VSGVGRDDTQHVGLDIGVVSTPGVDPAGARRPNADSFAVCADGRASWLEDTEERSAAANGDGQLVGLAAGDGDAASRSASAVTQVLTRLWQPGRPRDPVEVLSRFLMDAHTRMYWKAKERRPKRPSASVAAVWLVDATAAWASVGEVRVWIFADGQLLRLGLPWPQGDAQRMIAGSRELGDDTAVHLRRGVNAGLVQLQPGDRLILASPGLWRTVDEASLVQLLGSTRGAQAAAVAALERARSRGTREAVSVVVIDAR